MRAVNLLPQTQRRTPGVKGAKRPLAAAGAVLVLAGMGYWGYSLHAEAGDVKDQVAAASAERDGLRDQLGAFQAAQVRVSEQAVRRGAIVGLAEGRINWERLVRDISAVMPRQVWFTDLKGQVLSDGTAATTTATTATAPNVNNAVVPQGVHIDGFAFTQDQVALLMSRLSTVSGLGEPRLATSEVQQKGDREVIHFVIDVPIDQRAQDRPTLTPVSGTPAAATTGVTP